MTSLAPATIFGIDIYKNLYRPQATEAEIAKVIRITIIVLALIAVSVAAFLPPILAAMTWLFSWLVPVFWVVVFGLFWKRDSTVAISTLFAAWTVNSAWSFTSLPTMLGLPADANAYVTMAVTLTVGIVGNLMSSERGGFFASSQYQARIAQAE
jgi:SSS family solute:Na+ symporter